MYTLDLKLLVVLLGLVALASCAGNATTAAAAMSTASEAVTTPSTPTTTTPKSEQLTDLILDSIFAVPKGIAEACIDGAKAFEKFLGLFG